MKRLKSIALIFGVAYCFLSGTTRAESNWAYGSGDGFESAGTANISGSLLGQFCHFDDGACSWILVMETGCEADAKFPVLVNTDKGALHALLYCEGRLNNGKYRYIFVDFDAIDSVIRKGALIGIALPLQADHFKVVRFSLEGSALAIATMRSAFKSKSQGYRKAVSDEYL